MKYSFIPCCIAAITFTVTAEANANYYYVAANAGVFQANMKQSYLDQTDAIPQNIVQSVNQNGYTGGVWFGYRHYCNEERVT